jgi:hypothetical protein
VSFSVICWVDTMSPGLQELMNDDRDASIYRIAFKNMSNPAICINSDNIMWVYLGFRRQHSRPVIKICRPDIFLMYQKYGTMIVMQYLLQLAIFPAILLSLTISFSFCE